MDEIDFREHDIEKIAKSWSVAMKFSKNRLEKVYKLNDAQLDAAIHDGRIVLETVCLFVHSSVKGGQFKFVQPGTYEHAGWADNGSQIACRVLEDTPRRVRHHSLSLGADGAGGPARPEYGQDIFRLLSGAYRYVSRCLYQGIG